MVGRYAALRDPPRVTDPRLLVLQDRLIKTIRLVADAVPEVREHADDISRDLGDGIAQHQDKLVPALTAALAELKKPIRNDGIDNVVLSIYAADDVLKVGTYIRRRAIKAYLGVILDQPQHRAQLPGLITRMAATLEGTA